MSFFKLSTGAGIAASSDFDSGGGDIAPIPKNTNVLAAIEEAKVAEYQGEQYINIRWRVAKPDEYKNRVIFQKLRCWDSDSAKADKALAMLVAIDTNCGGKLLKAGAEPTDMSLQQALIGRPMVLNLQTWEIDGKSGNWVKAVSAAAAKQKTEYVPPQDLDDDLPF